MDDCTDFVRSLQRITPYVALDSQTFGAAEILSLKPWLIKPNEEEIEALVGHPCPDLPSRIEAADTLYAGGICNVLLSLGGNGALYVGESGRFRIEVPAISPLSTIGAGDSTLAGFLSAYAEGLDGVACLARACAFGSAACLEPGTNPPRPDSVDRMTDAIRVLPL
jgi:fructose-1-phosphate kinase PfkB-like protein